MFSHGEVLNATVGKKYTFCILRTQLESCHQDWAELLLFSAFMFSGFSTAVLVKFRKQRQAVTQECFHLPFFSRARLHSSLSLL